MQTSCWRRPSSWPRRESATQRRSTRPPTSSKTGSKTLFAAWSSAKSCWTCLLPSTHTSKRCVFALISSIYHCDLSPLFCLNLKHLMLLILKEHRSLRRYRVINLLITLQLFIVTVTSFVISLSNNKRWLISNFLLLPLSLRYGKMMGNFSVMETI